jgi:hypothetical protein
MDKAKPEHRSMRTYTVAALLGLFVVAAVLAIASRLLPGGLSRMAQRALRGGHDEGSLRG